MQSLHQTGKTYDSRVVCARVVLYLINNITLLEHFQCVHLFLKKGPNLENFHWTTLSCQQQLAFALHFLIPLHCNDPVSPAPFIHPRNAQPHTKKREASRDQ
ncbi:hypothetical protein FJTKL_06927 [Diaporthe vaccinii]|uniref:Uncharacterized protein n=1 Tax=Diaporthe vaccinii TaxID=105482 RepID=A0ABR4EVW7_9PEZI